MTRVTPAQQKFLRDQASASEMELNQIKGEPKVGTASGQLRKWQDRVCALDAELNNLRSLLERSGVNPSAVEDGKLSIQFIEKQDQRGLYCDGRGLYLQVSSRKTKSWIFRFMIAGRARKMGLGNLNRVNLAEARRKAREAHLLVGDGIDPINERSIRKTAALIEKFKQSIEARS